MLNYNEKNIFWKKNTRTGNPEVQKKKKGIYGEDFFRLIYQHLSSY
jgi:hypothetical protein